MMALTFHGRLPGVVYQTALPVEQEAPLRLDVAAFVGFAERGPLDQPVMVEDISQYHAVFGHDLLLARQGRTSQPVYANLPTAIHSFFDNGGRRCYVVRVAGPGAQANRFRFPGLSAWNGASFETVVAPAAWVGRWSNSMSIGTQLCTVPLYINKASFETLELYLELSPPQNVRTGDLLRLQFAGMGKPVVFCEIADVQQTSNTRITTGRIPVTIKLLAHTLQTFTRNVTPSQPLRIERQNGTGWEELATTLALLEELPLLEDGYSLHVEISATVNIKTGDVLRIYCPNEDMLEFPIDSTEELSTDPGKLRLTSRRPRWQFAATHSEVLTETGWLKNVATPAGPLNVQLGSRRQYTFLLPDTQNVQVGDLLRIVCTQNRTLLLFVAAIGLQATQSAPGLTQVLGRSAWWEVQDAQSLDYKELVQADLLSFDLIIREGEEIEEVWHDLRFSAGQGYWLNTLSAAPLSGTTGDSFPRLDATRSLRLGAPVTSTTDRPFYLPLGMDDRLPGENFARPLPDNDVKNYAQPVRKDGLEQFDPTTLFLDPRLTNISARDLLKQVNQILYLDAGPVKPLQKLYSLLAIDEIGLIALPDSVHPGWQYKKADPTLTQRPPSAPQPDQSHFQPCTPAPVSHASSCMVCGNPPAISLQPPGVELLDLRQQLQKLPELTPPEEYQIDALLAVHHALINLCSARADALAVLSLPQHFQRNDGLVWQKRLTGGIPGQLDGTTLSYAAVYHPWLQRPEVVTPELNPLRAIPPDGTVCGMIAARERARGPWIAPANAPLVGVVGLTPTLNTADWSTLFNAQINIVRQQTGQFTLLSAHSLSTDKQLLQISVRRLLIFLRKLALQRGMSYVFENNNERFRQNVQASFERTLTVLLESGAISAFTVVTGSEINSTNDLDNGRFLIALKVAPTQPIEFITIMLVRAGEGLLDVLER